MSVIDYKAKDQFLFTLIHLTGENEIDTMSRKQMCITLTLYNVRDPLNSLCFMLIWVNTYMRSAQSDELYLLLVSYCIFVVMSTISCRTPIYSAIGSWSINSFFRCRQPLRLNGYIDATLSIFSLSLCLKDNPSNRSVQLRVRSSRTRLRQFSSTSARREDVFPVWVKATAFSCSAVKWWI